MFYFVGLYMNTFKYTKNYFTYFLPFTERMLDVQDETKNSEC